MSKNYAEKSINTILDLVSAAEDMEFLEAFYSMTLKALEGVKNDVRLLLLFLPYAMNSGLCRDSR